MAIKKDNTDGRTPADRAGLCWRTFSRNQRGALRVELRSGRIFILPYMHWGHAHLEKVEGVEELTIHFNSHEVRVEGQNLKELLLELQAANVELLRELPGQFEPLTTGVAIRAIRVKDAGMQQEMATNDRVFSV
jgi:hypothetical protein